MRVFDKDMLEDVSQAIPWDFHCSCGHVAASHWYVGRGGIISGRCNECKLSLNLDVCKEYKSDNLIHLEVLAQEKV